MTIFDYLNANPLIIIGVFILVIIIIFLVFHQGRELSIKDWLKIGPKSRDLIVKADENDKEHKELLTRISEISDKNEILDFQNKLKQLRSNLPDQAIYSLALRSTIQNNLLSIALTTKGGFAGVSYPGRRLYAEFPIEQLIGFLPKLIDAGNPNKLESALYDFFKITDPNIYGLSIPPEEFMMAMQSGLFILN